MSTPKTIRCAIYTRKSTDEGLDQEFNTLEAQREACEAYVKSQAHEGWRVLPERFDDGGHSGGTLERPAMQRLLERVRERRVDVILIYKIDRLTRSLADFARLAELFDRYGASFVSVTQQFNTTTSMGRLMLNVLLSFAQFEREIAGERIRDKIAASKKKGMWMGGTVPLGYDWKDKKLVVNEAEAETVRTIFDLYLTHGNVRSVVAEVAQLSLRTKVRIDSKSRQTGGHTFCRGHVYAILGNPIYAGRISHKGQSYEADHVPIIDQKVWRAVQQRIAENRQGKRSGGTKAEAPNLLLGILFDADGNRFTPSHAVKNGRRYRYYVEQALVTGETPAKGRLRRIPAGEIEAAVRNGIADLLTSPARLLEALGDHLNASASDVAIRRGQQLSNQLGAGASSAAMPILRPLLQRVTIRPEALLIQIASNALQALCLPGTTDMRRQSEAHHEIRIATRLGRRGGQRKLIVAEDHSAPIIDPALIKALAQAHHWWDELVNGTVSSLNQIAARENKASSYIGRVLRLAFLAPEIQEAIIAGRNAPDLTAKRLILRQKVELEWKLQRLCLS